MIDTQRVSKEKPREPVISANECAAALKLIMHLCDNIMERGDVLEEVLEVVEQTATILRALNLNPDGNESDRLYAAIESGLLPTFHSGSSRKLAGEALIRLIAATPDNEYAEELR